MSTPFAIACSRALTASSRPVGVSGAAFGQEARIASSALPAASRSAFERLSLLGVGLHGAVDLIDGDDRDRVLRPAHLRQIRRAGGFAACAFWPSALNCAFCSSFSDA